MENNIVCPLVSKQISPVDCMENRDLKDQYIPEIYKTNPDWKEICRECKYHEY